MDESVNNKKFVFIADMSGKAVTAFQYGKNSTVNDFQAEVKKQIIEKKQSKTEVAEKLRVSLVKNMQWGKQFVIHCDTMVPGFKDDYNSDNLPLKDLLFDSEKMYHGDKLYKKILKESEDKDENGNKGFYFMKEGF